MNPDSPRRLLLYAQLLLGAALFLWLLSLVDWSVLGTISTEQLGIFAIAGLLFLASGVPESHRLWTLARGHTGWAGNARLTLGSYFFSNILPTNLGGDAYKVIGLRRNCSLLDASAIVLTDRILGLALLVLGSLPFLPALFSRLPALTAQLNPNNLILFFLSLLAASGVIVVASAGLRQRLSRLLNNLSRSQRPGAGTLGQLSIAIVLFHSLRAVSLVLIANALGTDLAFGAAWAALGVAAVVSLLPVSVAGLGVREAAFAATLPVFGMSLSDALLCALLLRTFQLIQGLLGGLSLAVSSRDHLQEAGQ